MSDRDASFAICRLDQASVGTHGWMVRLQRNGVKHGRFFADAAWGGRDNAREMARQFRDRLLAHLARQERSRPKRTRIRVLPTIRNQSGVAGVSRIVQRSAKGVEYHFWQASWQDGDGPRKSIRFSVLKHGDEVAFKLACEARSQAMDTDGADTDL